MFRKALLRLFIVFILLVGLSSLTNAQGGSLSYGDFLNDTLNPGSPIIYTFSGNQNDVVTLYVIGSNDLQATLSISNSSGQPLAFSRDDALTPMSNDVRVTVQLTANDTYIVTLNNQGNAASAFTLSLSLSDPIEATLLTERIIVTIAVDGTAQQFIIAGNPDIPQVLSIQSLRPTVSFTAQLRAGEEIFASIAGGVDGVTFVLPASSSNFTLTIDAADSTVGAEVEIAILAGAAPLPATTEEAQTTVTDPNVCTVTATGVNVRGGPGTNFVVIGSLNEGNQFIATGQNSGWYNGTYNGQSAWVAVSVVSASGNCNLPTVNAPAAPVVQATTDSNTVQATSTEIATSDNNTQNQQSTTAPTAIQPTATATSQPFSVVSISCRWFQNDGATVDFNVTGPAGASFRIDVRQGSTTYSADRTLNQQGFLNANQRFGQAGNTNYTAYIVYNDADIASAEC